MNQILHWDITIFLFLNKTISNPLFDLIFPWITDLHKTATFNLIAYPLFLGLFIGKFQLKNGLKLFVGLILCLAVNDFIWNYGLKETVQRARPGDNPALHAVVRSPYAGYSFPSNHAANMFALATYSAVFLSGSAIFLFPIAALVGFSRIYNGVHFPIDVLCGALLGSLMGLIWVFVIKKYLTKGRVQQ